MASKTILMAMFAIFIALSSSEKVLFGEPAPITAEARSTSPTDAKEVAKEGRQSRVFTFPSQNQDSRTHGGYVITSPHYETTEDRFAQSSPSVATLGGDENRLLSLLPSFGSEGMQVGLDFKLPFFSIPYAKMFSALAAPTASGSGIFGSGSPFGGLAAASTNGLFGGSGSGSGGLSSGMATMAAMAVTAALLYPKVSGLFGVAGQGVFRDGQGTEDFLQNMNSVLNQFNIDGESCLKMALCSLGNSKRLHQRTRGRDPSSAGTTTPADVVEDILNLPAVKSMIVKAGMVQARDFGGSGGDCEYFNSQNKCPVSAQTLQKYMATLG